MPELGKNLLTLCQKLGLDGPLCTRVRKRFGYEPVKKRKRRKSKPKTQRKRSRPRRKKKVQVIEI